MCARRRLARFAIIIVFTLVAVIGSSIVAVTAGAAPRFGFIESVGEFLGLSPSSAIDLGRTDKGKSAPAQPKERRSRSRPHGPEKGCCICQFEYGRRLQ